MSQLRNTGGFPGAPHYPRKARRQIMSDRLTIVSVSDPVYLRHLEALAVSLRRNYPLAQPYFLLVNVDPAQAARLRKVHPDAEIEHVARTFATDELKRSFCANCRAGLLHQLLQAGCERLLYLDADSLVRHNLAELDRLIASHDITILRRSVDGEEQIRFASGVIGLNRAPQTTAFVARWAEQIDANEQQWFNDQLYFSRTFDELGSTVSHGQLPLEYIDWEFRRASPIWVGKGPRKFDEWLYVMEEKHYLAHGRSGERIRHAALSTSLRAARMAIRWAPRSLRSRVAALGRVWSRSSGVALASEGK